MSIRQVHYVDCGTPKPIENGKFKTTLYENVIVSYSGSSFEIEIPHQVLYSCNEGFSKPSELPAELNCNEKTGKFEPSYPVCLKSW